MTTRVYQYGSVPARIAPVIGEVLADNQLRLASRLWNVLVAIERRRDARYRAIMRNPVQERIDALLEEITRLEDEIRKRRQAARRKNVYIDDLKAALDAAREELGRLIAEQKASSKARHEAKRRDLTALAETVKRRIKRARQAAAAIGLFWGTYNDIVQRADVGRKAGNLHFRRYSGGGTLTAQIIGGTAVSRVVEGDHTFFQVDPPAHGRKWRYARMRIGSTGERGPVWLDVPIVYHRPIAPEAQIKSVSMTRREGRWSLNVTVNLPDPAPSIKQAVVAIDIGWRLVPGGIRIAYALDNHGKRGPLVLPQRDLDAFGRVSSLRSSADSLRDEFLPVLAEWLKGRDLSADWMTMASHLAQWRSGGRLCHLIRWWGDHRLDGDGEIHEAARQFRSRYLHLATWARNASETLRRRILERYRLIAARTAKKYGVVYIEQFDLRKVAKRPAAESDEPNTAAARYRQLAAPSIFRGALCNACLREGVEILRLPAGFTTRECHLCGHRGEWDQAEAISHRCASCKQVWDQDYNAAVNLLRRGNLLRASAGAAPDENPPTTERKWDRVRRLSQSGPQETDSTAAAR